MSQMTIYLDDALHNRIRSMTKDKGISISNYATELFRKDLDNSWPEGYFDLFGSLKDDTMDVPEGRPRHLTAPRESL